MDSSRFKKTGETSYRDFKINVLKEKKHILNPEIYYEIELDSLVSYNYQWICKQIDRNFELYVDLEIGKLMNG